MIQATYLRSTESGRRPRGAAAPTTPQPEPELRRGEPAGGYGAGRPSWATLGIVLAVHLLLLGALVKFDVISIHRAPKVVTMVELIRPEPVPLPVVRAVEPPKQQPPRETEVIAPPPIVQVAAPPPPVQLAPPAPPPAPPAPPAMVAPPTAAEGPTLAAGLPKTLSTTPIKYPVEARRQRLQGTVRLQVTIGVDGRVTDVAIAQSSGARVLDEAAVKAVRQWRFQPRIEAGQPVPAIGIVPIPFTLT